MKTERNNATAAQEAQTMNSSDNNFTALTAKQEMRDGINILARDDASFARGDGYLLTDSDRAEIAGFVKDAVEYLADEKKQAPASHFPVDCEHCNTKGSIPTPWDAYRERGTCHKCNGSGIRRVRVNKYAARACCAPQAGAPDCGEPVEAGEGWMVKSVGGGWNVYHQTCPNGYDFRALRARPEVA